MDKFFLTGRESQTQSELIIFSREFECYLHRDLLIPLKVLSAQCEKCGQQLQVASAFRNFDRQLIIWNDKVSGRRQILNRQGKIIKKDLLSDWELVQAILFWSALPGASRHHWGTDIDVFNQQCLPESYRLQLTLDEYDTGVLKPFNRCLNNLINDQGCEFYRPYFGESRFNKIDGIAEEPWHLSYRPLTDKYEKLISKELIAEVIEQADILLKDCILNHLDEIFRRFIKTK